VDLDCRDQILAVLCGDPSVGQYWKHISFPSSVSSDNINTTPHPLSLISFQKSLTVLSMGAWAMMNPFFCL
jgi:hypothetical protein